MSEQTKSASDLLPTASFADGFDEMVYWLAVARDKFNVSAFRDQLPLSFRNVDRGEVTAAPEDEVNGRFYLHCAWDLTQDDIRFRIHYHAGTLKHAANETEPYADHFIKWLGSFFESEKVASHIHAYFAFDLRARRSVVPITLSSDLPCGASFMGLALKLEAAPNGVTSIKWTEGESSWYVEAVATRTINFDTYTPYEDSFAVSDVLDMFLIKSAI